MVRDRLPAGGIVPRAHVYARPGTRRINPYPQNASVSQTPARGSISGANVLDIPRRTRPDIEFSPNQGISASSVKSIGPAIAPADTSTGDADWLT